MFTKIKKYPKVFFAGMAVTGLLLVIPVTSNFIGNFIPAVNPDNNSGDGVINTPWGDVDEDDVQTA